MSAPAPALPVSAEQRAVLETWTRSRVLSHRQVQRAQLVLLAADGLANEMIAARLGMSKPSVLKWRARFAADGVDGLEEAPGRGRRRTYGQDFVERVVSATLRAPDDGTTHWSTRSLSGRVGASHATVHRIWQDMGLQPHLTRTFKYSTDPHLDERVSDVVGLYMNPPENAIVLCVDEKSQIQALDRTQPLLPMKPHQVERQTHDYKRNGTTTLFAALDVATGEATGACYQKHRATEFLAFLELVVRVYPRRQLHVIVDNASSHKTPEVQQWLSRHRRVHLHFTPTGSSWLNQVETWFSVLSRRAIRRGVFRNLSALIDAIQRFLDGWNERCKPFVWVKSAEQILAQLNRQRFHETVH
ncbi:MAG: IS630 family transposase [Candidatus Dormibacteraeota bacterium]|uniref:IS630 family transposase n=1 Tax=Candidatus Amunia macphersoniae TaxID=3127014 RepID=A0A934KIQ2_9BACT|nr:IS630 family transposase [Candidatus Dormibacteraeota bacterium]